MGSSTSFSFVDQQSEKSMGTCGSTHRSDDPSVKVTGKVFITISGARDADAALTVMNDILRPEICESLAALKKDAATLLKTLDSGEYILSGYICCNYHTRTYSWCPGDPNQGLQQCSVMGNGCPAKQYGLALGFNRRAH